MAESVDATALKAVICKNVRVRVSLRASGKASVKTSK